MAEASSDKRVTTADRALGEGDPSQVDDRFQVQSLLGRGGMGAVYRVRDRSTGDEVALKRLSARDGSAPSDGARALFEREFHTLNQLEHPCVVRAFDYGLDGDHPYYTMELLDGGDLREQAPLPAELACAVAYELCSVLGLLHARRLVHRDITPRNIRLSADGHHAKLIDFGLLSPMGPCEQAAGTPPYVAPEVLHQGSLDGRADLFSLGATLYFVLTGCAPFAAKRLRDMRDAWRSPPLAIASLVPDVPESLEHLVMSLIRVDVDSRPKTAAEVMERLRPLLAQAPDASLTAARSHLTAPALVGRADLQLRMRKQLIRVARGRGGGFLVSGEAGTGRSRMLDVFVLEAKLVGAVTARAGAADAAAGPFGVASSLVRQLHAGAPAASRAVAKRQPEVARCLFGCDPDMRGLDEAWEVRDLAGGEAGSGTHAALRTWLLGLAAERPVAIAVDDLGAIDAASLGWLAGAAVDAGGHRLTYGVTAGPELLEHGPPAVAVLQRYAKGMRLAPFTPDETLSLLRGVFGDVANLQGLAAELHPLAGGKPRECMGLAQHLVDQGLIAYRDGAWQLPEQLDASALPASLDDALGAQVRALSPEALELGRLLALNALPQLSRRQLESLTGLSGVAMARPLEVLRQAALIVGGAGGYAPAHGGARHALLCAADAPAIARLHDRLADAHAPTGDNAFVVAHHRLAGEQPELGLDYLLERSSSPESVRYLLDRDCPEVGGELAARTLATAVDEAERLARPRRDLHRLWGMLASVVARGQDVAHFYRILPAWTALLRAASGYDDWCQLEHIEDPGARLTQALTAVDARYRAASDEEKPLEPIEAIRGIVWCLMCGIAVTGRTMDLKILVPLISLAEPFAPLSPALAATLRNAQAVPLGQCDYAVEAYIEAVDEIIALLDPLVDGPDGAFASAQKAAVIQVQTRARVQCGILSAASEASFGAQDPSHRVATAYNQRVAALQRGDWAEAEAHRHRAELLAVQNNTGNMFIWLDVYLAQHVLARDLTGLREVRAQLEATAARYPHWRPWHHLATVHYHRLSEQPDLALQHMEVLYACYRELDVAVHPSALVAHAQVLMELGRPEEALAFARPVLAEFVRSGRLTLVRAISLPVALAEAQLGQTDAAHARLQAVIAQQLELGIEGLILGRSYEYLARVAIAANDPVAFAEAAEKAAEIYRVGAGSMLAVRYRRLLEAAQRAGLGLVQAGQVCAERSSENAEDAEDGFTSLPTAFDGDGLPAQLLSTLCGEGGEGEAGEEHPSTSRTGGVFLLTEAGLTLCAANWQGDEREVAALNCYAQAQLELELDDDTCTQGDFTEAATSMTMTEAGDGPAGNAGYTPLALRARHEGVEYIVGIALLAHDDSLGEEARRCLGQLTRQLLASGKYCPRPAA